jgi:hypothetical protein
VKNCILYKAEHQHVLRFPFVRGLTTILLVGGLGVEDQRNLFREVLLLLLVTDFCGVPPKRKFTFESQNWKEKSEVLCRGSY